MRLLVLFFALSACGGGSSIVDLGAPGDDLALVVNADAGIACGAGTCIVGNGNVCCVEAGFEFCGAAEACTAGVPLYCGGASDCMAEDCCQSASGVGCDSPCAGSIVCRSDDECPTTQPRCCGSLVSGSARKTCAVSCD